MAPLPPSIEEDDHDGSSSAPYSTPKFRNHQRRRRTRSFSSTSSSSSSSFSFNNDESPPCSPTTTTLQRIPFSWEHVPGIPKQKQHHSKIKMEESSALQHQLHLQLPPAAAAAGNYYSTKKTNLDDEEYHVISPKKHHLQSTGSSFHKARDEDDPFLAALLKCSRNDNHIRHDKINWKPESSSNAMSSSNRMMSSLSDRFGFISFYTSCRRTCAVSEESIVYLPRRPTPHYLLNHRHPGMKYN